MMFYYKSLFPNKNRKKEQKLSVGTSIFKIVHFFEKLNIYPVNQAILYKLVTVNSKRELFVWRD